MNEFTALDTILAPGTSVAGYRRGDPVAAAVVENWDLEVGADVCEGDLDPDAPVVPEIPRPAEDGTRAEWEAWALAQGMPADDVAAASMEDLQGYQPKGDAPAAADDECPADSAKKDAWVDYAVSRGLPRADAEGMTKADLQAWEPEVGDPVALSATEAAQA